MIIFVQKICKIIDKCLSLQSQSKRSMKTNEMKRRLIAGGCYLVKEKTNHEWWFSPITNKNFPIPRHGAKEIPNGTLLQISKQSGVKF